MFQKTNFMKKPKSKEARQAEAKRGKKRSDRLKATKAEMGNKRLKLALKKKSDLKKQQDLIAKLMESRLNASK
jgi:hypothetical protein